MFESLRDDSTSANPVAGSGDSDVNTSGRDPFELQLHASPSVPRGRLRGPPGSRGAHTPLALVNAWAHEHRISPVLFWAVLLGGLAVVISLSLLGSIAASTSHLASASGGGGSGGSGGGGGGGGGGGRPSLANAAFDGAVAGWQPCVSVNGTATATAPGPGSTSFLTLFTNPNATGELLAEISADALGRPFLVSAIYDKGSWVSEAGAAGGGRGGIHASVSGGLAHRLPRPSPPSPPPTPHLLTPLPPPPPPLCHHHQLLHMPAESTVFNVFSLAMAPNGGSGDAGATVGMAAAAGLDLVREQYELRANATGPMAKSRADGAWGGWLATLPVVARRYNSTTLTAAAAAAPGAMPPASYLVSLTACLRAGFFVALPATEVAVTSARVASALSFPANALVRAQYQVRGASGKAVPTALRGANYALALAFSVALLPATQMAPRVADDRVGYFTTHYVALGVREAAAPDSTPDWNRPSQLVDPRVTLINRRRLSSTAPAITYYVDPSVPLQWRPYMKRGVENWNAAFEQLPQIKRRQGSTSSPSSPLPPVVRCVLPGDPEWPADYHAAGACAKLSHRCLCFSHLHPPLPPPPHQTRAIPPFRGLLMSRKHTHWAPQRSIHAAARL